MYIDGYRLKDIEEITNIKASKCLKMIKKCLELDEKNMMFGYTGLIPYKHLKQYGRKQVVMDNSSNFSGALTQLFDIYPTLRDSIDNEYLQRETNTKEKNIKPIILFEKFIRKCKEMGIKENEYPFNTKNLAKRSFYEYINDLEKQKSNEAIMRYDKNAIQKYKSTGINIQTNYERLRPYSKVQIDGYKIDLILLLN